jgi:hypothetical protein
LLRVVEKKRKRERANRNVVISPMKEEKKRKRERANRNVVISPMKEEKKRKREKKLTMEHACISNGWFTEKSSLWPGQQTQLQVKELLHVEKSKHQDVLVFQSTNHGNVLVLDGVIQVTERDEFCYQELIANLPIMSHRNPTKVTIKERS